jgi:hypothetical protein
MDECHAYWLAALIDGEGSIIIRRRKGRSRLFVCITIAQNDRRLLDRAIEYAGCGTVYGNIGRKRNGHQLQIFRQADVRRILEDVAPFLVLKRERAFRGLEVLDGIAQQPRQYRERGRFATPPAQCNDTGGES